MSKNKIITKIGLLSGYMIPDRKGGYYVHSLYDYKDIKKNIYTDYGVLVTKFPLSKWKQFCLRLAGIVAFCGAFYAGYGDRFEEIVQGALEYHSNTMKLHNLRGDKEK